MRSAQAGKERGMAKVGGDARATRMTRMIPSAKIEFDERADEVKAE